MSAFKPLLAATALLSSSALSAMKTDFQTRSLDGEWEIAFDRANAGRDADWNDDAVFSAIEDRRKIVVPSAWELIEQDYEGVAFYRRQFEVPTEWKGRVVHLRFGAVNYIAEVWINGEPVGYHEGGFTPFEFRVDGVLRPGEDNVLIVRVLGPIILSQQSIDGIGPLETPQWRGGISGGIWQSVTLEASGPARLEDVFIKPDFETGNVTLDTVIDQANVTSLDAEVIVTLSEADAPDRPIARHHESLHLHPGENKRSWTLAVADAHDWSPDDPFLYRATVQILADGKESHRWTHRFGFRELTIRDGNFQLNGKRIHLKATFFEGLYPNGIATPDSEAMARREIALAKEAGFNTIRPWRHPPTPGWLDLADEMGVLVVGSPAVECMRLPLSTPYLPARVEREVRESILRDRNRTCIIQWELFNELHRPILKQMMRPMAMLARKLDPTRLILDESGGWAFGANMYLIGDYEPTKFNDIHHYPGPFINEYRYDSLLAIGMTDEEREDFGYSGNVPGRNVVPGLMSYISELGYGSLPNLPQVNDRFKSEGNPLTPAYRYHRRLAEGQRRALDESGFGDLYPDLEEFCLDQQAIHGAANKRMIEAARANPRVDGYCIHALVAGDWILGAGLLDIWRNPKSRAYEDTKAANQPRIISIRMSPRNIYAKRGATLSVIGINELDSVSAALSIEIDRADGTRAFDREVKGPWASGVSELFSETLDTVSWDGAYVARVRVVDGRGNLVTENALSFDVFPEETLAPPHSRIAVLDLDQSLTPFLRQSGIDHVEFDSSTPTSTPVFVTSVKPHTAAQSKRFADLIAYIKRGGTAVYLGGTGMRFRRQADNEIRSEAIPVSGKITHAQGLWTCIPHLVRAHPIFEGLPTGGMMRDVYENVWPRQSIREIAGEPIVASIGFDWFSWEHKLHYSGPGESWWGADVVLAPYGDGRCLLSELRIIENLGRDPVADLLLNNLIRFTTKQDDIP